MTDDLLDFKIRMFLGCIIVEECLEIVDEIVRIIGDLEVSHDDVVGGVGPIVVDRTVDPICFA